MGTDLTRIGERARKEPGLVLTSLYHHIYDVDNLRACYDTLEATRITWKGAPTMSIALWKSYTNGSTARAICIRFP